MIKFYKKEELLQKNLSELKEILMERKFKFHKNGKYYIGVVCNIIPSQPDALPYSIIFEVGGTKKLTIDIPDIEIIYPVD